MEHVNGKHLVHGETSRAGEVEDAEVWPEAEAASEKDRRLLTAYLSFS